MFELVQSAVSREADGRVHQAAGAYVTLGMIVAPLFRLTLHRVIKKELNEELEKDIA